MMPRRCILTSGLATLTLVFLGLSTGCLEPHQRGDFLENTQEQQPKPGQGPSGMPEYHPE
jgi:hypothetical protein